MSNDEKLEAKFWKALKSDMTVMLALPDVSEGHSQPMTAQVDEDQPGSIWFFTDTETDMVKDLGQSGRSVFHFADKGHDLFATVHGELSVSNDPAMIDKLWNPFVAAWYEGGKTDPRLVLLRFDAEDAQIWLNENNVFAGMKMLLGKDPKKDYKDKVAEVRLS